MIRDVNDVTLDFVDNHEITLSILHEDQPYLLWSSGVRLFRHARNGQRPSARSDAHAVTGWLFCLIHPLELCQISCFCR